MRQLLQYEIRKLINSKSFWICGGLLIAMTLLGMAVYKFFSIMETQVIAAAPDNFEYPASLLDYYSGRYFLVSSLNSAVPVLLSIFIALFVSFDFSQKTVRNVIAKGYSRSDTFLSKLIVCMLTAAIFSFLSVSAAAVLGSALWGFGGTFTMRIFLTLVTQILLIFSMTSFYMMLAMLIRNPGIAVAATILGFSVIGFGLAIFDVIMQVLEINIAIYSFHLPILLEAISTLDVSTNLLVKAAVCAVIWIIVLNGISAFTFSKRDV